MWWFRWKYRRIRRALRAAWWALHNADNLTMLRWELVRDGQEKNSRGGSPLSAVRAHWYWRRYLNDLPIR